jgi:hypothetical protein
MSALLSVGTSVTPILTGAFGAALVAILGVFTVIRKIAKSLRRIGHFLDDWSGEPARPGVPQRLGVLERLDAQDQRLHSVEERTRQLAPNGGSHLIDAIGRMEVQLKNRDDRLDSLARVEQRLDALDQDAVRTAQLHRFETRLNALEAHRQTGDPTP